MKFQGAVIKEQGVTFAVIVVKSSVINNRLEAKKIIDSFQPLFPGIPIILMAQDSKGFPHYFGRKDLVKFMVSVPIQAIPWKEFYIN